MNIFRLGLSLLFSIVVPHAMAADIKINFDQANPPFMYARDGKAAGVYPQVIEAAFRHMKTPVSITAVPWARAIQEIDQGSAGVGGIYKNAEREKKYDYSEQIFVEKLVVYFNKSKPLAYARVDDLKGLRVGVIRGWSYGDAFDAARKAGAFTVEEVVSDEQNFGKLDAGRLDVVLAVAESGSAMMRKFGSVSAAATPLAQNPTFLAFSKAAGQTELLRKFDQAVKQLKSSGEFDKLVGEALNK